MDGDLATTSLEQLGRDLAARTATGVLRLTRGDDHVEVLLRDGVVVHASGSTLDSRLGDRLVHSRLLSREDLARALQQQATASKPLGALLVDEGLVNRHVVKVFVQEQILDTLFWPLRWMTGEYAFIEQAVPEPQPSADMTIDQLLYALESRHRTWDEVSRTIPTPAAVPEFVPGADPSMASLEAGETSVLTAVDGRRTMQVIADELGFSTYEVGVILHGLALHGLVRLQPGTDVTPDVPAPDVPAPDAPLFSASPAAGALRSDLAGADGPVSEVAVAVDPPKADEPEAFVLSVEADEPEAFVVPADEPSQDTPVVTPAEPALANEPVVANDPSLAEAAAALADSVAAAPQVTPPAGMDMFGSTSSEDDDDVEVWTMEIVDDDDDEPSAPRVVPPRAEPATPISAPVSQPPAGLEPTDSPATPPNPEPDAGPAPRPKPASDDVSDLLRELRHLSDD